MAKVSVTDAFPSKWLSSSDLEGREIIATLADSPLDYQEFKQPGKNTPDRKPVLYFRCPRGTKPLKPMVLNKVNFTTLIALLGDDDDAWAGRQIIIGSDMVEAFGELKPGLRIRNRLPKSKAAAANGAQRVQPQQQLAAEPEDYPTDDSQDEELF